jgi:hypothetical protein
MSITEEKIEELCEIILRQTDYTKDEAREKLQEYNYDHLKVIRDYLGVTEKKELSKTKSINQEIYTQLRHKLDNDMQNYQKRVERGEVKKIV